MEYLIHFLLNFIVVKKQKHINKKKNMFNKDFHSALIINFFKIILNLWHKNQIQIPNLTCYFRKAKIETLKFQMEK